MKMLRNEWMGRSIVSDSSVIYKTLTNKRFGNVELTLNIFIPKDHKLTDKRPAIVFFFSGV